MSTLSELSDSIAQGRVWSGKKALELGLVDELGYLEDGVKAAAELANLETYDTQYIQRSMSKSELFWKELFQNHHLEFNQSLTANLERGLEEGIYRDDLDPMVMPVFTAQ